MSEADNLRETFRIIVDAITEEHPNSDEPQIVRSPLKTRPQSKRKSSEPIRRLSNLEGEVDCFETTFCEKEAQSFSEE